MTDLATWLLQQISEDEQIARAAIEDDCGQDGGFEDAYSELIQPPSGVGFAQGGFGEAAARMIVTYAVPRRVLAECAAKRQIIALHDVDPDTGVDEECSEIEHNWPCPTIRFLMQPYAGRPGWQEEWGQ